jgi:hypothetical protein
VLSEEIRELLRAECYARQARREEVRPQAPQEPRIEYDGRWFYAACCRALGVGPVERVADTEFLGYAPGWYRVTVAVPAGWDHLGLLPFRNDDGRWHYPREGEWTGWVSAAELHLVRDVLPKEFGRTPWPAIIHERLTLRVGRPLDAWVAEKVREGSADARAVLVETIGKLASRESQYHTHEFHTDPASRWVTDEEWLTDAEPERVYWDGSTWRGRLEVPLNAWTAGHLHPELSAQVWARARARMARYLLRIPAEDVLEIAGDAVVLARDPHWVDDGKVGTLRRKR